MRMPSPRPTSEVTAELDPAPTQLVPYDRDEAEATLDASGRGDPRAVWCWSRPSRPPTLALARADWAITEAGFGFCANARQGCSRRLR